MQETLNYASPPAPGKSRLAFSVASMAFSVIFGTMNYSFFAGEFEHNRNGDTVLCFGLAGIGLSLAGIITGLIGSTGRHRKFAIPAILAAVVVVAFWMDTPWSRNIALP